MITAQEALAESKTNELANKQRIIQEQANQVEMELCQAEWAVLSASKRGYTYCTIEKPGTSSYFYSYQTIAKLREAPYFYRVESVTSGHKLYIDWSPAKTVTDLLLSVAIATVIGIALVIIF